MLKLQRRREANRRRGEKSMERRNGGGNCQADIDGWKKGRGQACRYREGERREKKQQRKGREVVHFCSGRQLTAGKLVKRERERNSMRDFVSWHHSKKWKRKMSKLH